MGNLTVDSSSLLEYETADSLMHGKGLALPPVHGIYFLQAEL